MLLFSYGTLQDARVQLATFGRRLDGTSDTLTGYRVTTIRIHDPAVLATSGLAEHLALVVDPDAPPIAGTVLTLTPEEVAAADRYEGDTYRRVAVALASGRHAFVYVLATTA
ncbi:gamma-glutamylcyclotransferase family protein [Sphingomonas sp. KR1UV-12]|uniref:Gamma-glutamylcyclotransferase family protein n=1 Tax=Sphingomonas aurea TaxID=3063994 RepID=A0ABT9EGE1_9SPHN|nr:gamma-glutamylcyclotransferase family protein [Sphingomonas sp. KR1UV-12]MDP1025910.1 gamma-glutamylcyclotransferase family protein [Sphingomonas sp. KR1UV-12]